VTAWSQTSGLSRSQRLDVLHLLHQRESELGREALDEGRQRLVVHGGLAHHWLRYEGEQLVGYALATGHDPTTIEEAGGGIDLELLSNLRQRGEVIHWWTRDNALLPANVEVIRTIHLLEISLPVPVPPLPVDVHVRAFEPGRDDERWLEQNNLAFADHPEQGAWRQPDLALRLREPWFDPSGFLLFLRGEEIVASCWTKVHELTRQRFGEIYVISVHPNAQGMGLGRVALTHGLDSLRRRGVTRAVLFVDDSNLSALHLYGALGFRTVRQDHLVRVEPAR
jgi:mycothiol synthase